MSESCCSKRRVHRLEEVDFIGKTFDCLTVKECHRDKQKGLLCRCECVCGRSITARASRLSSGTTRHCRCRSKAALAEINRKNAEASPIYSKGLWKSNKAEHRVWVDMVRRCEDSTCKAYGRYGYCGITICKGLRDPQTFIKYAGPRPDGMTIDRIEPAGHYRCGLCEECLINGWKVNIRWAYWVTQSANKKKRCDNTSGFRGVVKTKMTSKTYWKAEVKKAKTRVLQRYFAFDESGWREAAKAVNLAFAVHYPEIVWVPNPDWETRPYHLSKGEVQSDANVVL